MSFYLSTTDQQILSATSIITTYGGLLMVGLGLIGNTMNILAFCYLKVYRSLSTSAFLATASLSGQVYLFFSLLLSALANLMGYNPLARNNTLCRVALYVPRVTVQISLTCLCFSAIDRYLMTSRSARQRAWVTVRRARISIIVFVIVWLAYGVPSAVYGINYPFFNLCIPSAELSSTVVYLNLVFAVLLPIMILCLFGFLTWKNLGIARLSSMNVQVTKMILLDVAVVTISNVPTGCYLIYVVTKSGNRLFTPVETLLIYMTQILSSTQSCGSFYFYLTVSSAFRKNIRAMLVNVFCCGKVIARADVGPISATVPLARSTLAEVGI